MKALKAVIFDMDGVLIDSEPIHNRMMLATFSRYGIAFDPKDFGKYVGTTNAFVFQLLKEEQGLDISVEEMDRCHYENLLRTIRDEAHAPIPGIPTLLEELSKRGIPAAIASSSSLELISCVVEKFGLRDRFTHLTSGEDLPKSKPDPAIYLLSAEKLGVAPADCLVIEDAALGVEAAKAAGMTCVGFRNPNSGNQDLRAADVIVDKIADIRLDSYFK